MTEDDAIDFHRNDVLRLLQVLFVIAGFAPGAKRDYRLPGSVQRQLRRKLLPLESAARRLIYFIAKRLPEEPARKRRKGPSESERATLGYLSKQMNKKKRKRPEGPREARTAVFWLFDKKRYCPFTSDRRRRPPTGKPGPRISFLDGSDPPRDEPKSQKPPKDPGDARKLWRRMQGLTSALDDLPGHARRLRRLLDKRKADPINTKPTSPIRNGIAPGLRWDGRGDAFELLRACHRIATERAPPEP